MLIGSPNIFGFHFKKYVALNGKKKSPYSSCIFMLDFSRDRRRFHFSYSVKHLLQFIVLQML